MNKNVRCHIFVSGIVQGVFFRAHTEEIANSLGLKGWVKNLPDGRVEIVAEGPKDNIEQLIQWCHRGPPSAKIDNVEIQWEDVTDEFANFKTVY